MDRVDGGREGRGAARGQRLEAPLRRDRGAQRGARRGARGRLRRFRKASALAVAVTGMLFLIWGVPAESNATQQAQPAPDVEIPDTATRPTESFEEATGTIRELLLSFYALLPKLLIALGLLIAAGVIARLIRPVLRRVLRSWGKAQALSALSEIFIWLFALGAALSVIAGDARALVGSVGLFGLALSWALQTPIESFTGWLLNSFKGYYAIGDRIGVGDVFGDVYDIDVLTTTIWEAGGPEKPVEAAQTTGALITVPNAEVLRSHIINYTREFPYVWDEIRIGVSNDSDLGYAAEVVEGVAHRVIGSEMANAIERYRSLLEAAGLRYDIAPEPKAYFTLTESWTDLTLRYLVLARRRRMRATRLLEAIAAELAQPEHRDRIGVAYPRTQVEFVNEPPAAGSGPERRSG